MTLTQGALLQGTRGAYRLDRRLGEGGFGETWAATREGDGQAVAVKMLRIDRLRDWKALELFEREAKVLAELDHPAIPAVYDYFSAGVDGSAASGDAADGAPPTWFLVQAFVPGRSLRQMIRDRGRLDNAGAEALLRQLLDVLRYLHSRHPPVIHRDIHPGNVIVDDVGAATLVDFGAIQDRLRGETGGSTTIGTFGYVPMEQLIGKARPASDLFALGMTMLVALSHREPEALPFDEATSKVEVDAAVPGLSPGLRRALGAMVEPVIGARPASADAALALLDGAALERRATANVEAPPPSARWRSIGAAAIGVGGLAAGLIYVVFFDRFSETELVRISALWVAPVAFGVGVRRSSRSPLAAGLAWSGAVVGLLILFIYGIFPSL
ncbi:MAG: serine/threonine-protein kinase [Nannocystaceae bacterium]